MTELRDAPRTILVADAHSGRAQRLAQAIESDEQIGEGRTVCVARQGVEALEIALASSPVLVVVAHGLPLVDAPRLAEIVRSNPRTHDAVFLFLGEPAEGARFEPGIGDRQLPATLRPEDLAEAVGEMLERRRRIALFDASTGRGEAGEGALEQISLADLVQLLHVGRKSGRLEVEPEDPGCMDRLGTLRVREGEVVDARVADVEGEKAFFRMLSWESGHYRFGPDGSREAARIQTPTRVLLQAGLRQLAEWNRLSTQLPPVDSQIRLIVHPGELPSGVHPLTQEVLVLLEVYDRVGDVVDHCSFPDYQVLRTLRTLEERGVIAVGRSESVGGRGARSVLFDVAQIRRLREWTRESQGRPRRLRDAKLVVSASDAAGLGDFANLIRPLPGVSLSPEMESGAIGQDDLERVGRVRVDDDLGIELVHLPSRHAFAPLWATAAYGALGIVFLLGGALGDAAQRLDAMTRTVARVPRARVFHVALLGKQERPSPD